MKATMSWLGTLFGCLVLAWPVHADNAFFPYYACAPQAPDACHPGFYAVNHCGAAYGPNYCLRPCYPPFNGFRPPLPPSCQQQQQGRPLGFPTHPFARSPRDFFMLD